jgi:hypothetical protein
MNLSRYEDWQLSMSAGMSTCRNTRQHESWVLCNISICISINHVHAKPKKKLRSPWNKLAFKSISAVLTVCSCTKPFMT